MNPKDLVNRAKGFFDGEPSYGDPAMKILDGLDSESALRKPNKDTHNAAELLAHIVGWEDVYLRRFHGETKATIDQNLSFDWKRIEKNEKSLWHSLVVEFEKNHRKLVSSLEKEEKDAAAKEKLLNEIMEHDIYHLGQIALMKKIVS